MLERTKIEGIQVARALAAVSVMIWHSNLMIDWIPADRKFSLPFFSVYGYAGVWLFFVISGFIIAKSLSSADFKPAQFIIRRGLRIYPLYILATIAALALQTWAGIMFYLPDPSWKFIFASLAILPLPDPLVPFYQPGWTLEHEVVFYVLAAAIFMFARRLDLIIIALIALGAYSFINSENNLFLLHLTSPYQMLFAAGMLLYVFREPLSRLGSVLPFMVFIWTAHHLVTDWSMNSIYRLGFDALASVSLCLSLLNFKHERLPTAPAQVWRAMVYLGEISFSLYLVHWFVYRLVWRSNTLLAPALDNHPELVRWTGFALAIAASALTHRYIEVPTNEWGRRLSDKVGRSFKRTASASRAP